MGTFTLTLKEVLDHTKDIGLADYPIWKESHRQELNRLIIDTYLFREIAHETIDMFVHRLNVRMRSIMPYYVKLAETEELKYSPLVTVDIETINESSGDVRGGSTSESGAVSETVADGTSRAVNSDLPQTMLSGNGDYASSATDATSRNDSTNESTTTGATTSETSHEDTSASRQFGYSGSPAALIQEYRAAILNIDLMIVNELETLFMGVWGNTDAYTSPIGGNTAWPSF